MRRSSVGTPVRQRRGSFTWRVELWQKVALALALILGPAAPVAAIATVAAAAEQLSIVSDPGWMPNVDAQIGATQLWGWGGTGAGVGVALIDTGVVPVDGLTSGNVVTGPDLSLSAGVPAMYGEDAYGHGTFMAGIIAGRDSGISPGSEATIEPSSGKFVGVAPDATLVNVKVGGPDGSVDPSQVIAALDWVAVHHADPGVNIRVVNLSYGTGSTQSYLTDPLAAAVERVWRAGVVVAVAAGNDGQQNSLLNDPAVDPYVIAVGADGTYGSNGQKLYVTSFTNSGNSGRHVDLVAPGNSIVALRDPGSYVDMFNPQGVPPLDTSGRFFRGSGTSEATAVVSGVVADLLEMYPSLTPDMVKNILMASSTPLYGTTAGMVGAGSVNAVAAANLAAEVVQAGGVPPGPRGQSLLDLPDQGGQQSYSRSSGSGSLDATRAGAVVKVDGMPVTGQKTVFGVPYNPAQQGDSNASWDLASWGGGYWTSHGWTNQAWQGDPSTTKAWADDTWSSHGWSSAGWSSHEWSSHEWSSTDWSSHAWSGNNWGQPSSQVQFRDPSGVAVDSHGDVWVADTGNNEVDEFDSSGIELRILSTSGNGAGANGMLQRPMGIATDKAGDVYVADSGNNQVEEFSSNGTFIRAFTADGSVGPNGSPGQMRNPEGVAVDSAGNVYVADTGDNRVVELSSTGKVIRALTATGMRAPQGVAVDSAGRVYVADTGNNRVEEFSASGAFVRAWMANGNLSLRNPRMQRPQAVAVDARDDIWIADTGNNQVEEFSSSTGRETYWTTTGAGPLSAPGALAVDASGNVYIADGGSSQIEEAGSNGVLTATFGMDSEPHPTVNNPQGVAIDAGGRLWVADTGDNRILVSPGSGVYLTAITSDGISGQTLNHPSDVAVAPHGDIWVADTGNNRVEEFTPNGQYLTGITSNGLSPSSSSQTSLRSPEALAVDSHGNVYVADTGNNRVEEYSSAGIFIKAFTSNGMPSGHNTDLSSPSGVAVNAAGDVYVSDTGNNRVEEFSPSGIFITAWDSSGTPANLTMRSPAGLALDDCGDLWVADTGNNQLDEIKLSTGAVTGWTNNLSGVGQGTMNRPAGVVVDQLGNVFAADTGNSQIDEFSDNNVLLSTIGANNALSGPRSSAVNAEGDVYVADTGNNRVVEYAPNGSLVMSFNIDGNGAGQDASMNRPSAVTIDSTGNVYVADTGNNQVEEFSRRGVFIRAFTATGIASGPNSTMKGPEGVAVDSTGNVYVADTGNNRVEKFSPDGTFLAAYTTNGPNGSLGAPGQMRNPTGVAVDSAGNLYVADSGDNRVVELTASGTFIRALTSTGISSGPGSAMNGPEGVAVDDAGNVYVADTGNNRVEELSSSGTFIAAFTSDGLVRNGQPQQLDKPTGVAINSQGRLYVTDTGDNLIVSSSGKLIAPAGQVTG